MSVVYSLYDALVSIKVPDDKAKAVIDALEREMMDKLATKADVLHVRELLSKDIQNLSNAMTIKLGAISGLWTGILFTLLKLTA
jgi:hypothetical protein